MALGTPWYVIGANLEIKGVGQEPYLAKAELHTRSARTTRVQGEDTIFIVTRDDDPLTAKGCAPKLQSHHNCEELQDVHIVAV